MTEAELPLARRLWIYQAERIPLGKTALLVAVFSAAGVSASAHFAGRPLPDWSVFALAFGVTFAFFVQMRASDEVKDAEADAKYRPERPIPRGLVSLQLVVGIGLATVPLSLFACWLVEPSTIPLLLLAWAWLLLMSFEFFVPSWLSAHPLIYMASHMAIMPLIDLFVTGTEWVSYDSAPNGLGLFLALSFVNGCILEIGRKLWAPENERVGVDSYSSLYGTARASGAWMLCICAALAMLVGVGFATGAPLLTFLIGSIAAIFAFSRGLAYRKSPSAAHEKAVDNAAGLWVFACYVAAGFAPLLQQVLS